MKIFKYDIKTDTFAHRGVSFIDDRFGVYLVTGKQGTNKTYYSVQLSLYQDKNHVAYVKTNVHSMELPGYKMKYFTKIKEIYDDIDENVIYIIDEVSKKYHKNSPTDKDLYAFLNQSRKRKRIVIMITQEYLELPMWIRRPCRYMLTNIRIPILSQFFNVFGCVVGDGYNLVYDKDEGIYTCPTILTIIYKRNRYIASMYDTFEPIQDL